VGNGIGVAGLAPGCRLMTLRAGNAGGYLQEDDVVAALLYAWSQGAAVVNMSFGDTVVSPVFQDVVTFLADCGMILVASAGNTGNQVMHYPSAYPGVISVGASTREGYRWPYSNFGAALDLLAPGDSIVTTQMGGGYGAYSGTSLAAPFVTATVGMIRSIRPDLNSAQVRSLLRTSCQDRGRPGWDNEYGAGLLNTADALMSDEVGVSMIDSPVNGSASHPGPVDSIAVTGTAMGNLFDHYQLSLGMGTVPIQWELLAEQRTNVFDKIIRNQKRTSSYIQYVNVIFSKI